MATMLFGAVIRGDLRAMTFLLRSDPSLIEARTEKEMYLGQKHHAYKKSTPLIILASEGHASMVKWLLEHEAKMDAKDCHGRTALHYACFRRQYAVMALLLQHGVDINNGDGHRECFTNPLLVATAGGSLECVRLLLSKRYLPTTDLETKGVFGNTALYLACKGNHLAIVKLLLDAGADPTVMNDRGRTPLDQARKRDFRECVALLEAVKDRLTRVRLLHQGRCVNDAEFVIQKAYTEAIGRTRGDLRTICVDAAPSYLKRRVGEGRNLPRIEVHDRMKKRRAAGSEEEEGESVEAKVVRFVLGEKLPRELFTELVGLMYR